ncbi:hypothetical protein RHGRI_016069 [Rhododendron griersonianum]|uniref:Uncharacterized protein n=1 Tax=Rhododendron griersonianum TaxID=479676 RepID=A0AAV6JSZ9_9ERIC|nr:hypothetical protein RHGRI_016069 [Rhododendron griersonianum]
MVVPVVVVEWCEMENLSNNSLFWSLKQRRSLTCDLWDLVKNDEHFEIYEEEQIFSLDPTRWRLVFNQDTKLKALADHVERLNTGGGSSSNLAVRNPKDFATRCCWKVIRKTFAHFQSINRKAFGSVEEFQLLVESSFPYYIPALRKKALFFTEKNWPKYRARGSYSEEFERN